MIFAYAGVMMTAVAYFQYFYNNVFPDLTPNISNLLGSIYVIYDKCEGYQLLCFEFIFWLIPREPFKIIKKFGRVISKKN